MSVGTISEPALTPAHPGLTLTVVVCAFADERLEDTVRCVESALGQSPPPTEVIVVVDHNPHLLEQLRRRLPSSVGVTPNLGKTGLSSARNTAIGLAHSELVAFLDDDAIAQPGWLATLRAAFTDSTVVGAGGRAVAAWDQTQPSWFPDEFLWVVGCSYRGQPDTGEVRNPLGCNMAFRAEVFTRAGLFDTQIGRLGKRPLGCEETELCIRARREIPDARFVLVQGADILHRVPQSRGEPEYLVRRCFYEGISKALVRTLGDTQSLDTERLYVSRALPVACLRAVIAVCVGPDRAGALGRVGAITGGLAAAGVGYIVGAISFRDRKIGPAQAT